MAGAGHLPGIVALAELKAFLRFETDLEDALLAGLLRSAEATVEAWVGQILVTREIVEDGFARNALVPLAKGPVRGVLQVAVANPAGEFAELRAEAWRLLPASGGRARVKLMEVQEQALTRVRVRYLAGLADDWNGVPEPLRQAIVRTAAHGFTHRDLPEDAGVPPVVRQLVEPWRHLRLI